MAIKTSLVLIVTITLLCSHSHADVYIVTHQSNPVASAREQEIQDLYLGRTRALEGGEFVTVFDREVSSQVRARFYERIAGMSLRQADAYWARLVFAGRLLPLEEVVSDQELVERIQAEPSAIGYMDSPPNGDKLKTLLVLKEAE